MKQGFIFGAIAGAVLGIGVAVGMDLLLGSPAGGSWSEAVARDLTRATGQPHEPGSPAVSAGVVGVVLVLGLIGALLGGLAGAVVGRFVGYLSKET